MVDDDREWLPPPAPPAAASPLVPMPVDSGLMPPPPLSWSPYAFSPPIWSTNDPTTKTRVIYVPVAVPMPSLPGPGYPGPQRILWQPPQMPGMQDTMAQPMMGGMFQHAMGGGPAMAMQGPFSGFPFGGMMQGGDNGTHTNTDMNMQQQQQPQQQQQFRSELLSQQPPPQQPPPPPVAQAQQQHQQKQQGGDREQQKRGENRRPPRHCQVEGCGRIDKGRGLCKQHGGGKRCGFEGCIRASRGSSGLCINHGGGPRCAADLCYKSARTVGGFCKSHGGGRRCRRSGCNKTAQGARVMCADHLNTDPQEAPLFPASLDLFALDGAFDFDDDSFL